MSKVSKKFISR